MSEYIEQAFEELKRVDHLIYVSLKYTRTVDVIKSIIDRIINCFDLLIDGLLQEAYDKGKIEQTSKTPVVKCEMVQKLFKKEQKLKDYCNFYLLLRKINRAQFDRAREFRRHVTMTAYVDEKAVEVNIDIISDYFKHAKKFLHYIKDDLA
tara:strand:+ start:1645 stop:2094 length:450 start_codon:yes stop_codon:yes gene_type:complete